MLLRPPRSTPFPYTTLFRSFVTEAERAGNPQFERIVGTSLQDLADQSDPVVKSIAGLAETASARADSAGYALPWRSEEHTSELQSLAYLVCRLLLEKKNEVCEQLVEVQRLAGRGNQNDMRIRAARGRIHVLLTHTVEVVMPEQTAIRVDSGERVVRRAC